MPRLPNPVLADQWRDRLSRFDLSDLKIAQFCQLEGCSTASFYQWRKRLAHNNSADHNEAPPPVFVSVNVKHAVDSLTPTLTTTQSVSPDLPLRVELPGGATIRLDAHADDQTLRQVLAVVIQVTDVSSNEVQA